MVDSIRPTYRSVPTRSSTDKVQASSQAETHTDDKSGEAYIVTKDRRKNPDRRNSGSQSRRVYDMRSGRGRRKDDGGPGNIEIKV